MNFEIIRPSKFTIKFSLGLAVTLNFSTLAFPVFAQQNKELQEVCRGSMSLFL